MRVVIAGGSGFLGRALAQSLVGAGHLLQVLTRHRPDAPHAPTPAEIDYVSWNPDGTANGSWASACAGTDVVVNLAGESIGARRWTLARKAQLRGSRLLATRSLVRFIAEAEQPPAALVSSSAIGVYGDRGAEILAEDAGPGEDFLAKLAEVWEHEALAAQSGRTRVVLLRTGIVLDPQEGALPRMLTPFRLYAGGPFGSGRQFMSWIHRDDWVALARWAIETPAVHGPINLVAPHPVANADFARALGRALDRPAVVPAPGFALKIVLGEMAGPLLLNSQRVVPARALAGGFRFAHPSLDEALADLLK
ncbi:MAG: TIGR01777 family oxidoreductase [Rhodospirillaceae bacterium]